MFLSVSPPKIGQRGPEGKNGHVYNDYEGVAIECQNYPDAPNKADYPCCVLRPGETYEQAIIFAFGIR